MKTFTEVDRQVLKKLPKNRWFHRDDEELWHVAVHINNFNHRLERLEELGQLESKIVGEYPDLKRLYRVKS